MALWGTKEEVAHSAGKVDLSNLSVTNAASGSSGTFFANNFSVGQVIVIDGIGEAVIDSITDDNTLTVVSNTELRAATATTRDFYVAEKPTYVIEGDTTLTSNTVFGVSNAEVGVTTANVNHAGWVHIGNRYTDSNSNVRQKTEVLVAMSSIEGDADDDNELPDS